MRITSTVVVRSFLIVLVMLWLFMSASLLGEVQSGISSVVPFFVAVLFCLAASVIGLFFPLAGGLLLIAGGIAILIGGSWVAFGPLSVAPFAIVAVVVGAALAWYGWRRAHPGPQQVR